MEKLNMQTTDVVDDIYSYTTAEDVRLSIEIQPLSMGNNQQPEERSST